MSFFDRFKGGQKSRPTGPLTDAMLQRNEPQADRASELAALERPIDTRQQDLLDRQAVARALHRSIATAPKGWSTRVGLYGPWGSGKTSVLHLLERIERDGGSVVVTLSAWSASGEAGILSLLYEALVDQLKRDAIDVEPLQTWGKRIVGKMARRIKGWGEVAAEGGGLVDNEYGAAMTGSGVALSMTGTVLSDWATLGEKDLRRLQEVLGGRRVVVFIDDIDRADPRSVPKTLLALREILNWPGFAFVLAFDRDVVGRALAEYSRAYGESAEVFLEKVVDVPFDLPDPTPLQAARLAKEALDACCDFIPASERFALADWLPCNPRRSKLAARKLGVLRTVSERHDEGEIDWLAVGLQYVLRTAYPALAMQIEDGHLGMGSSDWISSLSGDDPPGKQSAAEDLADAESLKLKSAKEKVWLKRLVKQIVQARSLTTGEKIAYEMGLLFDEPAVTWKEFRSLIKRCSTDGVLPAKEVEAEISAAQQRNYGTRCDAAKEIFDAAVGYYGQALESASQSMSKAQYLQDATDARTRLEFLRQLHSMEMPEEIRARVRSVDAVKAIYDLLLRWAHFDANEADAALRAEELALIRCASAFCPAKAELFMLTRPTSIDRDPFGDGSAAKRRALGDAVRDVVAPGAIAEVLSWFEQPGAVSAAIRGELVPQAHWLLGSPESPLYVEVDGVTRLVEELRRLPELVLLSRRAVARANVWYYMKFLLGDVQEPHWMTPEQRREFFQRNAALAQAAWKLFTSEEAQFRSLHGLRELHSQLLSLGVPSDVLDLPSWLSPTDESRKAGRSDSNESTGAVS